MFYAYGYDKDSKITRLAQWEQVKKSSGVIPEGLTNNPNLDDDLIYLWNMYTEILSGSEKVGFIELKTYSELMGVRLSPWEISTLIEIETIRRKNGH